MEAIGRLREAAAAVAALLLFATPAPAAEPPAEGGGGDRVAVRIKPEKRRMLGVEVSRAARRPLRRVIRTVGRVTADERRRRSVTLHVEGWVEKLHADFTGKAVREGDLLAEVYSPELVAAQLEYANLLRWKEEKGHRFQRNVEFNWGDRYGTTGRLLTFDIEALLQVARQKLELWEVPGEVIDGLERGEEPRRLFPVRSPVDGYVTEKPAAAGVYIPAGGPLFTVEDLSVVWVVADVYDHELPFVREGQEALIRLSYLPGVEITATLDYLYPDLSERTRSVGARFVVPNESGVLRPSMFAEVELAADLGEALTVPVTAVIDTGRRKVVYVEREPGLFARREIETGRLAGGVVEVTAGLAEGEQVVTSALFMIDSEAVLEETGKPGCCNP